MQKEAKSAPEVETCFWPSKKKPKDPTGRDWPRKKRSSGTCTATGTNGKTKTKKRKKVRAQFDSIDAKN